MERGATGYTWALQGGHLALIHFSLEQTERVPSTGLVEVWIAGGRLPERTVPAAGHCW